MSKIDPTVPIQGNPTTASVRANFATAKAEIEALQSVQFNAEVNLANFMTAQQLTDFKAGTLSFDAGALLQSAVTYAAGLIGVADNDLGIIVRIPAGKGQIQTAVTVPAKVNLVCDGMLINNLASTSANPIIFSPGSHCDRLLLDANTKMGVLFGTAATDARSRIGEILIKNVDSVAGIGVRFIGNIFQINRIRVEGGLVGVDFGDGGVTEVRHFYASFIYAYTCKTGVRFYKSNMGVVERLVANSCATSGAQVDTCFELSVNSSLMFWDDGVAGASKFTGTPWNIGTNSVGNSIYGLYVNARVINTASANAMLAGNVEKSKIFLDATKNEALPTGQANPISAQPFKFGSNWGTENQLEVHWGVVGVAALTGLATIPTTGSITVKNNGNDIHYNNINVQGSSTLGTEGSPYYATTENMVGPIDISFANQTTPQVVNGLGIASQVNASEVWRFEADIDLGDALATTGVKVSMTFPAGASGISYTATIVPDVVAAGNQLHKRATAAATVLDFTTAMLAGVGQAKLRVVGRMDASGSTGTMQINIAQSTSSATNLTVKLGSIIRARRTG